MVKLGWSKNVHEERDAPFQILLGAMNPSYCVLLSFAIFLEYWFATHLGLTPNCPFVFGLGGEDMQRGPERTKKTIYTILKKILSHPDFTSVLGDLGSHSF